jgi:F0F1-type ATP synthase assembly protein I
MAKKIENKGEEKVWTAYGLALSLGYMIVTPILIFGVGGVLLDKYLNSYPIFIFLGFLLAMTSAMGIVWVKMKDMVVTGIPKKEITTKKKK